MQQLRETGKLISIVGSLWMMYRLRYFPESGNSYKLALILQPCGQAFKPAWPDFAVRVTCFPNGDGR